MENYFSSKLNIFFKSKYFLYSLILIIIHQSLIASSVVFLTKLIESFQNGIDYKDYLIFYLLCMIIPYIPGVFSFLTLQKWINTTHQRYLEFVFKFNKLDVFSFNDVYYREKISSLLSRNSFQVINSTLYFIHDFLSLFLNSFFSIIVFFIVLPNEIFIGYFISLIVSFFVIFITKNNVEKKYYDVESNNISYGNCLNKFPENYSLNNKINRKVWTSNFTDLGRKFYESSYSAQLYKQCINLFISVIALLPTSYLIYNLIVSESHDAALVAAIIVNLTRIFTVLSSLNTVLSSFVDIPSIWGSLKILFDIDDDVSKFDEKRIKKIYINGILFNNDIKYLIDNHSGRFTITGENGAGKTTLLNKIKDSLGTLGILVPTNLTNIVWSEEDNLENLSTGQKMKKILDIVKSSEEKYILLDEWDANLDSSNRQEIDNILNAMSEKKVIIEIRH